MTPEEHYKKAEKLVAWAEHNELNPLVDQKIQMALVHAQLSRAEIVYSKE